MTDGVNVIISNRIVFNDYEIFNIIVQNKMQNRVYLDDLQSTGNIYLQNNKGNKFNWLNHEYLLDDITVQKNENKQISLKFNKQYEPSQDANAIVFKNIIVDNNKKLDLVIEI